MITKIKQKRIRILYIITSCKKTGPVQQTLNIIKNLDKKFEPVLLTLYEEDQDGTSRLDEFLQYAVHYFVKTSKTDILLGHTKALKKKMQEIRPDVIHSLGVFPDYAVSKIHEYPHLITLRNYIWDDYPMMYGRIRGGVLARLHIYAMDHATKTVTCSESLSWIYKKKLGKEFSFIRNGVDVQESALVSAAEKPEIRKELGIGREDFVFIYSGLFIDRKNQEFLVRTFADTFPETNVKLVLLGDGPNFDEIRNAYGFYRNVMFPGNVLDVVRYLKASDVYVSVSKSEGMPNGVLEAMAFGLPVLLSDIIQHKEIMRVCRECGFLYKQNDASSLSEKMKKMTGCNMGKMIQHSFDTAHGSFHAAKMSEKYQQQYGMLAELNSGLQVKTMKKKKMKMFLARGAAHLPLYFVPDEMYIKLMYYLECGERLNLKNPVSYNEKVQWLKLHDRNPEYTDLADKCKVKEIVAQRIGERFMIPSYGVWDRFEDIDFSVLPERFVLKCTHNSGGVKIIDKNNFNIHEEKAFFDRCMRKNFYWYYREWPYKNIKPRIIAEKYIGTEQKPVPDDYKIFCFDGKPRVVQVDFDRLKEHKRNLYTTKWKFIPAQIKYPYAPDRQIAKPDNLDEMLDIASRLSKGMKHVRVDLYNVDGTVYFGEMTFYHGSGMETFTPESFGKKMGEWLNIT